MLCLWSNLGWTIKWNLFRANSLLSETNSWQIGILCTACFIISLNDHTYLRDCRGGLQNCQIKAVAAAVLVNRLRILVPNELGTSIYRTGHITSSVIGLSVAHIHVQSESFSCFNNGFCQFFPYTCIQESLDVATSKPKSPSTKCASMRPRESAVFHKLGFITACFITTIT